MASNASAATKDPTCFPPQLRKKIQLLKDEIDKIEHELKRIPCYMKDKQKSNVSSNKHLNRPINSKVIFSKAECPKQNCQCKLCTYRRCEACDHIKNQQFLEGNNNSKLTAKCCTNISNFKHKENRNFVPAAKARSRSAPRVKNDITWAEVILGDECKCKCCCPLTRTAAKSSVTKNKDSDYATKITKLEKKLADRDKSVKIMSKLYAELQNEFRVAQAERDQAKFDALLKTLAEEKLKIFVEEKSLLHMRHDERQAQALEKTLQQLAEARRKASEKEMECIHRAAIMEDEELNDSASLLRSFSRKLKTSSPNRSSHPTFDDISPVKR